jgi:hypothetical protein
MMDYTLHVDQPSERVIPNLMSALQRRELRAMITFDLRLARADHVDCDCPYHSTEDCTCQYAVLLVYDPKQESGVYRTITIHGRDEEVWLSLLKDPSPPTENTLIHEALEAVLLDTLLSLVGTPRAEIIEADQPVISET